MFRKTKELQSLVNASRNSLKEAESKIKELVNDYQSIN